MSVSELQVEQSNHQPNLRPNVAPQPTWVYQFAGNARAKTIATGLALGVGAGVLALLIVLGNPLIAAAALLGAGAGVFVLTNLRWGLYATVFVVALLPFGTLPVRVAITPTLIDVTLGGFLLVYMLQWMRRERSGLKLIPAHVLIIFFVLFMIFSFVAGLANAPLTTNVLRKFAEMVLSILSVIVVVDVLRTVPSLRQLTLIVLIAGTLQAAVGIGLYAINDDTAERVLNTFGRIGYPQGGVIRYIEDNPALGERAIGTWVDPNAYGGFLMMIAALAFSQVIATTPVTPRRWQAAVIFGILSVAVIITQSRGAFLALAVGIAFIALLRYRYLLIIGALALGILLVMPFMQPYIQRLIDGFQGEDLATQMRFGEYKDALVLIGRYPVIGVGFTGAPDRDIYLGVSNMYLKIASAMGIVGLGLFIAVMLELFRYGLRRWDHLRARPDLVNIWLGFTAGVVGTLVSGFVDHFYFNIEFQGAVTIFWLFIGCSLAAANLAILLPQEKESTIT